MAMEKYKLFWKFGEKPKKIYTLHYGSEVNYYAFLQEKYSAGYRQVIISSEAMIAFMREANSKDALRVYRIELAEDDSEFKDEIDSLVYVAVEGKVVYATLLDRLFFLADDSSIEIKRIYLKGRSESGTPLDLFLQSNGIVGCEAEDRALLPKITLFLQNFLFG